MLRKIKITVLLVLACCAFAIAAQSQSLKIVPDAAVLGVRTGSDTIQVGWIQLTGAGSSYAVDGAPVDVEIYFSRTPAGGNLGRYTRIRSTISENVPRQLAQGVQAKYTRFIPDRQGGTMGPGAYYCIVAAISGTDTLYSDYFKVMVESPNPPSITYPVANPMVDGMVKRISELTPRFTWRAVSGVPYYHVILCDGPIFTLVGGEPVPNDNLNVIWQAITPNTEINYGAPDPSGTITATPPPLSRGKAYSWLVLNNFGNHMAFTSSKFNASDLMFGQFEITGTPIRAPRVVTPVNNASFNNQQIEFKWTNRAPEANSYLINVFSSTGSEMLGVDGLDFNANLLIWETTVSGRDTSVIFDAPSTLTSGDYTWRVYAIDNRGAASTDSTSASTFRYTSNMGRVSLETVERIAGVIDAPIGFVELRTEVITGPTQAPLGFFTDHQGIVYRDFPRGTYRITAVKEGYNTQSVTVSVGGSSAASRIYMTRPEAIMYGRVLSASDNSPVNQAKVTAISEWGDTIVTFTSGNGSYTLNGKAADWTVYIEKAGHRYVPPIRRTLRLGDNIGLNDVLLQRNPFTLSGVVGNSENSPVSGARVSVLREGVLIDELASTSQNGMFAFYLTSGTYTLVAEKAGFAMFSREIIVTGNRTQNVTIREGAVLVNGSIIGRTWSAEDERYVSAPVTSARIQFEGSVDTLVVTSDATFGRFSISLPEGMEYTVRVGAAGFDAANYTGQFSTNPELGSTRTFADTVYAFGVIRGRVRAMSTITENDDVILGDPIGDVDVIVYDTSGGGDRIVATGRTALNGFYEVRNIPNGAFRIGAGRAGYFAIESHYVAVNQGRPEPNAVSYDFEMGTGDKTVRWNVVGYNGSGSVKIVSPLNRTIEFDSTESGARFAELKSIGPGRYVIEAVAHDANSEYELLQLSRSVTMVDPDDDESVSNIFFPFTHHYREAVEWDSVSRSYRLGVESISEPHSSVTRIELYYRSESSVRFRSAAKDIQPGVLWIVDFSDGVRDGTALSYYFLIHLQNGDVYGSSKQIFTTQVKPNVQSISRIVVEPSVLAGDTLFLPSSYTAQFTFRAFYSDLYVPFGDNADIGTVKWSIGGVTRDLQSSGTFQYNTGSGEEIVMLQATLVIPESSPYSMRANVSNIVEIPVKVTGSVLDTMIVMRKGSGGPIHSTGEATGFFVGAFDANNRSVAVSPQWSIVPAVGAGVISADGMFEPNPNFFGNVRIIARVGGKEAEYVDLGAEAAEPGLMVHYMLRHGEIGDTVTTLKGLRLAFPAGSVAVGEEVEFSVALPELRNHVHRGSDGYRMADTAAFDVVCDMFHKIESDIAVIIDVPRHLREAARDGKQEFRIARWSTETLTWIPIDNSVVISDGSAVAATLSRTPVIPALSRRADSRAAAAAAEIAGRARYALVTKTNDLTVSMSVSPHPFSPYIRPVREHGPNAQEGTCIKVMVEAPEAFVRSIRVHIHNATGKRVWAVAKSNAENGENIFWWNGRTSGKGDGRSVVTEETWENFDNSNKPMCRNGRYFVTVIVTDLQGRQKRLMKPVVLMK